MKKIVLTGFTVALALAVAQAQTQEKGAQKLMEPTTNIAIGPIVPPPIYIQQPGYVQPPPLSAAQPPPPAQSAPAPYVYDQQPVQAPQQLISQTDAQSIVDQFRSNYSRLGSPRFLIYVNRDLVDGQSGMRLSARSATGRSRTTTGPHS